MKLLEPNRSPLEKFANVAVLGAAGKMGSGISLLVLQEMARCRIMELNEKKSAENKFHLILVDTSRERLDGLHSYLQGQMLRFAEKNIIWLRKETASQPSLVSNKEIIDYFVNLAMKMVHFTPALQATKDAELIFEATFEDVQAKIALLTAVKQLSSNKPYFLTNTSSIPISELNKGANLEGKIIGFHFYNPPAVQKLIEIIPLANGDEQLASIAQTLAQKFHKQIVYSKDIAGFIGNGYFLREINFACDLAKQLSGQHGLIPSIYLLNKMTQEFLLRPMGIFQLMDYVGLDVVDNISKIMNCYLPHLGSANDLIEPLLKAKKIGGQFSDGSQREGLFAYENQQPVAIYDPLENRYQTLAEAPWKRECDAWLGSPPEKLSWKSLSKDAKNEEAIGRYFMLLKQDKSHGAKLALEFLQHLLHVEQGLVDDGVAKSLEDVEIVLRNGFYHLYDALAVLNYEGATQEKGG